MTFRTKDLLRLALLTALSLLLFLAESALPAPVPLPGVKLGLANVVTVWLIFNAPRSHAPLMLACRVLIASLFPGGASALPFALCGGAACMAVMLPARAFFPALPMPYTSAVGAVAHNVGQLAAAVCLTRSGALWSYLPFLLLSGLICGAVTGAIAALVSRRLGRVSCQRQSVNSKPLTQRHKGTPKGGAAKTQRKVL